MTEVDFYVLASGDASAREVFACRLADKAFRQGLGVYVHAADQDGAARLDELLWTFRPASFVPHALRGQPDGENGESSESSGDGEKVAVGWGDDPGEPRDVLINLSLQAPDFADRFDRVAEVVVSSDPAIRDPLRASWQHYKDRGCTIRNNKID